MQFGSSGDRIGVEQDAGSQFERASEVLRRAQAMLSRNEISGAAEILIDALDDARLTGLSLRSPLALLLARLLAAQGHLAAAVKCLAPVLDYVEDRLSAAHIYCARAVELAAQGELSPALNIARKAEELAPSDDEIRAHVEDLYTVVVPAFVLTSTAAADGAGMPDVVVADVFQRLILRFQSAPNNLHLAHVIALLAEQHAARADTQALQTAVETAENNGYSQRPVQYDNGEFDAWHWAIRCWVLLAFRTAYWRRWYRHVTEVRGESERDDVDLHAAGDAALARIRHLHERLRDIYRQSESPLFNLERAERHQRLLIALATERKSAQALTDLTGSASDLLRAGGFVGPIAGPGLLAAIGRLPALQQFLLQQASPASTGTGDTVSAAVERLRQSLSPFSPMYTMHEDLGWPIEAEAYCRRLAASNVEPRTYLASLLCQHARVALDAGDIVQARKSCIEALHLAPKDNSTLELLAKVSERRVQDALATNRTNFAYALRLAKQDLAETPSDRRLKAVVARVLRLHAQHLLDLLGDAEPNVLDAKRILALQNEAWGLDPDPEWQKWTLAGAIMVVTALVADPETANSTTFEEAEATVSRAEHMFASDISVVALRVGLLRTRVNWHLLDEGRIALLRGNTQQIEALVGQVERAWNLDRERNEDDQRWTAISFVQLAEACIPDDGWPATLAPFENALAIIESGSRLVPGQLILIVAQAELLRRKANAIINLEGGFDGAVLSDAAKRTVVSLFAQSWKLDASVAARGLAIARACVMIDAYAAAEWYAHAAMTLEPANAEARDLWALIRARPAYDAATRDEDYAEQLIHQGRSRDAVGYLMRANETLARCGYNPAWETFTDLHRVVRHNLDVLRRAGFW